MIQGHSHLRNLLSSLRVLMMCGTPMRATLRELATTGQIRTVSTAIAGLISW
jgi:hypothetical protein